MQELKERKIRENMSDLVDLTSNVDAVVKLLRESGIISEEEQSKIANLESPFDKKSQLYWLISRKEEDDALSQLIAALKATGNDSAAEKLADADNNNSSNPDDTMSQSHQQEDQQEAHVDEEGSAAKPRQTEPDHEGMALAQEFENELDRIENEVENEPVHDVVEAEVEVHEDHHHPSVEDVAQFVVDEVIQESEVRVEITAPTESEPEQEIEETKEPIHVHAQEEVDHKSAEIEASEVVAEPYVQQNGDIVHDEVKSEQESFVLEDRKEKEQSPDPTPKSPKQVSFGEATTSEPKEFVINEEPGDRRGSIEGGTKSIVALNRERFEKASSPNGEAPKVKFTIAKKGSPAGTPGAIRPDEEPKASTVQNLRNFFQKLGSNESEEGVAKRPGGRGGAAANRRTMF
jgi:hypothetical protein